MTETTVFKSNRSQAVRLPKAVALPDHVKKVEIYRLGQARLIVPSGHAWDDFFDGPAVTDDFMVERGQPEMQRREAL
ncbi:antitoxin [Thioalkalivibrio denitrificans]|uniref:Antitoxin n=1 Tax=Thioalkalivibrio denitrificans TaxID=108003 RepID=A0A1V3N7M5_9GAMM|nr:type II toxin-antitoxin system VapB family antitoxin [Thioalkalivibrio denitrificans]OOG20806.1 antitoxin [Thioalkalivibrio denitrificans]